MQKQAPTTGKLAMIAVFALSCFLILTYLWTSFGGPTPISAKGYRFQADFEEATQLADNADVRISGVTVGHVKKSEQVDETTRVEIEIEARYAPIPQDTRATLRQKTLLGETYVELTPGSGDGADLPDGGQLPATPGEADRRARRDPACARRADARRPAALPEGHGACVRGARRGRQRRRREPVAVCRGRRRPGTTCSTRRSGPFASSSSRQRPGVRVARPPPGRAVRAGPRRSTCCWGRPRAANAELAETVRILPTTLRELPSDAWPSSRPFRARHARSCATFDPPRAHSSRLCRTRFRWRPSCAACSATSIA